jgi:POT family proton-dependent oligopeptide transporter
LNVKSLKNTTPDIKFLYLTQALYYFGFYGLKSIFVLYAINHHAMGESQAISLFATYMCLSYGMALAGSTIADRLLGVKNSILVGGVLSFLATLCFTLLSQDLFCLGLAFMGLGMGMVKPNLISSVGQYYRESEHSQKDKAFSIFYMAIHFGQMLGSILCGFVAYTYGWNSGILLIALGFLVATVFLLWKVRSDQEIIAAIYTLLIYRDNIQGIMGASICASIMYFAWIFYQCNDRERKGLWHIIMGLSLMVLFGALYEQAGSSVTLFIEKAVDRQVLGYEIPTAAFASLSPMYVVVCSLVYLFAAKNFSGKNNSMSWLYKVAYGFIIFSASFLSLSAGTASTSSLISPLWVLGALFLQAMGEVLICPTIIAAISQNAPSRFKSLMIGYNIMSIAYSHYIAGFIAQYSINESVSVATQASYGTFFAYLGFLPLVVGASLFLFYRFSDIRRYHYGS